VSQALTLFTTPVIYLYLDRFSNRFAAWGRSADDEGERPASDQGPVKEAAE
jgi:HAE1 family hydrophobic/amphiphilic exporter-1